MQIIKNYCKVVMFFDGCVTFLFAFCFSSETDMFYLAISMVGTDFSMICQLFPHRARSEIKVGLFILNIFICKVYLRSNSNVI